MGIRGLQFYVENISPEVCRRVSIKDLADEIRTSNCEPVLVVDGMSLMHKLYEKKLDWICGGQWYQFVHLLIDFVQRFKNIGVRLVLFFDGTVCTAKRSEWVSRRVKRYKEVAYVCEYVKQMHQSPSDQYFQLPASMGTMTRYIFKFCCGTEVYSTCTEADQEIAEYAKKNSNVFAILSQDTDFLIYNTKPYLSTLHLNLDNMTTVLYDRNILARHLNLRLEQLPLFSSFLGNDILSREMLDSFHRQLFPHFGRAARITDLMPCVLRLMKDNGWTGDFRNVRELQFICEHIIGDARLYDVLYESLKVYSVQMDEVPLPHCNFLPTELTKAIQKRHYFSESSPGLFNILCNMEFDSSEVLEDCSDSSLPPASLVYRPVRQRLYGILFSNRLQKSAGSHGRRQDIFVKEWCAYAGNMLRSPDHIKAEPFEVAGYLPTIEEMWKGGQETEPLRVHSFMACIGLRFSDSVLYSIPKRFIALCSILHYFMVYDPPLLAPWELAAFIAQAVSPKARKLEQLSLLQMPYLDARGISLASVFMRGISIVHLVLSACGFPFPLQEAMPWHCFDGKLFQSMYSASKNGATVDHLCDYNEDTVSLFNHLLKVVLTGTTMSNLRTFRATQ